LEVTSGEQTVRQKDGKGGIASLDAGPGGVLMPAWQGWVLKRVSLRPASSTGTSIKYGFFEL